MKKVILLLIVLMFSITSYTAEITISGRVYRDLTIDTLNYGQVEFKSNSELHVEFVDISGQKSHYFLQYNSVAKLNQNELKTVRIYAP